MTAERERMVADMTRKMTDENEALMQRNVDVAQHVFNNIEVTEMLMRVAASVCSAAILVAIQTRRPAIDPDKLYDLVGSAIARQVQDRKRQLPLILEGLEIERENHRARR